MLTVVNIVIGLQGNLISSFYNVTRLFLYVHPTEGNLIPLAQLHRFSPSLKSLHMTFQALPFIDILNFAGSFPLLDNLMLMGWMFLKSDAKFTPSTPPPTLTGSFHLLVPMEMGIMVNHLLTLTSGIHFQGLILCWFYNPSAAMDLISACSHSLNTLVLSSDTSGLHPFRDFYLRVSSYYFFYLSFGAYIHMYV